MTVREDFKAMLTETNEDVLRLIEELPKDPPCVDVARALDKVAKRVQRAQRVYSYGSEPDIKSAIWEVVWCIKQVVEEDLFRDERVTARQVVHELVKFHFDLRDYLIPDSLKLKHYSSRPT